MKKRRILFITERRADYSRLKPIMKAVQKSKKLELVLLVTGAHLLKKFGETKKNIEDDGFKVDAILPIFGENDPDTGVSMVEALGKALIGMAEIFPKLQPDIIFCGFDLGAHLAAAITGSHLNIHVAHIQGGEVSGTIDEVLRHACTKFAHFHFVATEESKKRVIRLGEDPKYVFLVGSPSLDTIRNIEYPSKKEICAKYNLDSSKPLVLFLQHPVTTEVKNVKKQIQKSIQALSILKKKHDLEILGIFSNHDAGGRRIIEALKAADVKNQAHIPYEDFLRLMNVADVLIGNSSAGIHEAPSFGLPTVNVGTRQQHRERGMNVIDAKNDVKAIVSAAEKCLNDKNFRKKVSQAKNPYDHGDTAQKIVRVLETKKLPPIQKVIQY